MKELYEVFLEKKGFQYEGVNVFELLASPPFQVFDKNNATQDLSVEYAFLQVKIVELDTDGTDTNQTYLYETFTIFSLTGVP